MSWWISKRATATRWRTAMATHAMAGSAAETRLQSTLMRLSRHLLICSVLCFTAPSHAQIRPPISCAQAVGMGFDKFVEAETARTKDYSTAGTIAACDRYAKCKRAANERALKSLHSTQKPHVATARQELDKLESAIWTMVYVKAGGHHVFAICGCRHCHT